MSGPRVGIVCGCDVANYGDILFPLLAEGELGRRLPRVEVSAYGLRGMAQPAWPLEVRSLADLEREVSALDLLLVGGGQIVRWDEGLPPDYRPASVGHHRATSLWLIPTLMAAAHGVPVAWNAPGVHLGRPDWAVELAMAAIDAVSHLTVRDEVSARYLGAMAPDRPVEVVPDTAFGLRNFIAGQGPLDARWRDAGVREPYVLVQASATLLEHADVLAPKLAAARQAGFQLVEVPISPCNGDRFEASGAEVDVRAPWSPDPRVMARLISRASAVVGPSLHLAITALTAGVPVNHPGLGVGEKYGVLSAQRDVLVWTDEPGLELLVGAREPAPEIIEREGQLAAHWDAIAALVGAGPGPGPEAVAWLVSRLPESLAFRDGVRAQAQLALQRRRGGVGTRASRWLHARPRRRGA